MGLEDGRPGWGAPARLSRPVPVPCRRWSAVPGPPDPRPAITPTAEFANPMYGGAEEGAKPANPVYDSGDSPLAPAAGGYPGAAGTAGPSGETRGGRLGDGWVRGERCSVLHVTLPMAWAWPGSTTSAPPPPFHTADFTNTAFGEGLDTPKGDTVPSNPLFDTSTSQLSGPGGKAEYDDTKEAPVAAVAGGGRMVGHGRGWCVDATAGGGTCLRPQVVPCMGPRSPVPSVSRGRSASRAQCPASPPSPPQTSPTPPSPMRGCWTRPRATTAPGRAPTRSSIRRPVNCPAQRRARTMRPGTSQARGE